MKRYKREGEHLGLELVGKSIEIKDGLYRIRLARILCRRHLSSYVEPGGCHGNFSMIGIVLTCSHWAPASGR